MCFPYPRGCGGEAILADRGPAVKQETGLDQCPVLCYGSGVTIKAKSDAGRSRAELVRDFWWVYNSLGKHTKDAPVRADAPSLGAFAWLKAIQQDKTGNLAKEFFGATLKSLMPKAEARADEDRGIRAEKFRLDQMSELADVLEAGLADD